tara:strand:+ start:49059 stop:49484 length:426 start_codon:yes stop_codon:yes gene_type:complete
LLSKGAKATARPVAKPLAKLTKPVRVKRATIKRNMLVESVKFEPKQIQAKYKHGAKTYGLEGNYNKANSAKFESSIKGHMKNLDTKVIKGTYLKEPAKHFYNKATNVNVVTKEGKFVTTNKPTEKQAAHLLKDGNLGGAPK